MDTDVVSMLSPAKAQASSAFLEWLERADAKTEVFPSVVTIHEIERGIVMLRLGGATAKASSLKAWLSGLLAIFADRILGLDSAAAAISGSLEAHAKCAGHEPGMADAMIAGVAKTYGLTVVTRNVRHFHALDVAVFSPEDAAARAG